MNRKLAVALVATSTLPAAHVAYAQAVIGGGGGGGGLLNGIIQWFMQNIAIGLIGAAVIFVGILAMAGRLGLLIIAGVVCGALIIGNWSTIASTITSGFGG